MGQPAPAERTGMDITWREENIYNAGKQAKLATPDPATRELVKQAVSQATGHPFFESLTAEQTAAIVEAQELSVHEAIDYAVQTAQGGAINVHELLSLMARMSFDVGMNFERLSKKAEAEKEDTP